MSTDYHDLPADLPEPVDDGACDHLPGRRLPRVRLPAASGGAVEMSRLGRPRAVVYCYPLTGVPGTALPENWDLIPGARGCTPQACAFRDHHRELAELGSAVYAVSTQPTGYQREMVERLHLPFEVLSDAKLRFTRALRLPTFEAGGHTLIKRLTLIVRDGVIEHVFYPVFPSNAAALVVLSWLRAHPLSV